MNSKQADELIKAFEIKREKYIDAVQEVERCLKVQLKKEVIKLIRLIFILGFITLMLYIIYVVGK